MSRTLAERSVGERAGQGWPVAEWALGPLLSAPCELQPAPRSSEDAHVALWRHLLSLCCLFVFSLPSCSFQFLGLCFSTAVLLKVGF